MAENEEKLQEEWKLATEMKERYCDATGKETNVEKAAEIIHKIGLIYRKRSPDKISLIKSAGLFNAAILRNPQTVSQIKSDLSELCQHVLKRAKANNQNADLIKKGQEVKASFSQLRVEVENFLKTDVPRIPNDASRKNRKQLNTQKVAAIQHINKTIADTYKSIMADLSCFCKNVMGKAPCKFAVVGMGSLAREEITAYSDFEHVILLSNSKNYKMHLEYFKWFSTIFHIIVLNIQESIIPSLNIRCLNSRKSLLGDWYYDAITPRGISFDGMMPHACKFPLGRQQHTQNKHFTTELIKPVDEMLEYLSSDADLKNGYHLADILTKTCFVYGNETLFKQFADGAKNYDRKTSATDTTDEIRKQVQQDLDKFSTRFRLANLKSQHTINIKQLVYRSSTLFISALARNHNISSNSCFDIIDQLEKTQNITQNTAEKLKCAIAIACEMRLRVYTNNKSQCDNAIDLMRNGVEGFLNIVGVASTINYFQIAYCLQCEVAKQLNFTKLHFYSNPQLINISMSLAFGINDSTKLSTEPQNRFWDSSIFNFDKCIEALETKTHQSFDQSITKFELRLANKDPTGFFGFSQSKLLADADLVQKLADNLYIDEVFDEALEFYKQLLDMFQKYSDENDETFDIAFINKQIGHCLMQLDQSVEAIHYFKKALQVKQNTTLNADKDRNIGVTLHEIGGCYRNMKHYDEALTYLKLSLQIYQNTTQNADKDRYIGAILNAIGQCHGKMEHYDQALTYFNRSLQIKQNTALNAENDRSIGVTLHDIGQCHRNMEHYDEALTYFNRSLQIDQNTTQNADNDKSIGVTLHEIGQCHSDIKHYEKALTYLNRSLQVKQNTTLNADKDRSIGVTLDAIGKCHSNMKHYDEALTYLNRSLRVKQNTTLNADKDRSIGLTLHDIGRCHSNMEHYDEALTYLNRSLQIDQNTTRNADKDRGIGVKFHDIGRCYSNMKHYDEALKFLNRSLQVKQNTTQNEDKDRTIGVTLHDIGQCHSEMQHYGEALTYLKRSLQVKQSTTQNADKDRDIGVTLYAIGRCHSNMKHYDEALTYLNRSLQIDQNATRNADKDRNIGVILHDIGRCHRDMQHYEEALTYLSQSLQVKQNTSLNADKDKSIGVTLYEIGLCHRNMKHYDEALTYFNRSLQVKQNTTRNANKDRSIGVTLYAIGQCHRNMEHYDEALTYLTLSLQIDQNTTHNAGKDRSIGVTLHAIGLCHRKMEHYKEALTYFNRSLQVKQNAALNADKDKSICVTLREIERCHSNMKHYDDALTL